MHNFQKFKIVTFASIVAVGVYLTSATYSFSDNLRASSSIEVYLTRPPANLSANDFRPDGGFEIDSKQLKPFKDIVWLSVTTGTAVGYGSACAPRPCTPPPTPSIENRVNWIPKSKHGLLITKDHNYVWRDEDLSVDSFSLITETYKGQSYNSRDVF